MTNSVGSGLDVTSIVDGLMEKEKLGLKRLEEKKISYQKQVSAYTQTRNLIKNVSNSISKLDAVLKKNYYKVNSTDESVASATITNKPTLGNLVIEVSKLATAHQLGSAVYPSKDKPLNLSGTITLAQNNHSFDIAVEESYTLEDIKNSINNATGNQGINTSILSTNNSLGNDEYILLISSAHTGKMNQIQVDSNILSINNVLQEATDAEFDINKYHITRNTNRIDDVLEGINLELNQVGKTSISIVSDTSNQELVVSNAINEVINTYNQAIEELSKNQSLRSLKDSTYPIILKKLQEIMTQTFNKNTIHSILDIGIKLDKAEVKINEEGVEYVVKGKLTINNEQLSQSINQDLSELQDFFSHAGDSFDDKTRSALTTMQTYTIYNREQIISQEKNSLNKRISKEQGRIETARTNLTQRYAALDNIISKYQEIGNFIEQQTAMLNRQKK